MGDPADPKRIDRDAIAELLQLEIDDAFDKSLTMLKGSEGIYELIFSQIRAGYLTGRPLSAGKLADAFGVHRNTVAKILSRLAAAGYLRTRSGQAPLVIGPDPVFPAQRTEFLSQETMASRSGLSMGTDILRVEKVPLRDLKPKWLDLVKPALELRDGDMVIRMSRIRTVRGKPTKNEWVPAACEDAFFAERRLPPYFYGDLEAGAAKSISTYCESHSIKAVTGNYRVDVGYLPERFRLAWAERATGAARPSEKMLAAVAVDPFMRLETTTHTISGPMEFSVAYLRSGIFRINVGTLDVGFRTDKLAEVTPKRPRLKALGAR